MFNCLISIQSHMFLKLEKVNIVKYLVYCELDAVITT